MPANTGSPYAVAETLHAKKGTMTYVAKMERRLSDTEYRSELSRAKAAGGYYSAYKAQGAIPGFQFPSAAVRDAFVAGYGAGQVLGSRAMRGMDSLFGQDDMTLFGAGPLFQGTTQGGDSSLFQAGSQKPKVNEPVTPIMAASRDVSGLRAAKDAWVEANYPNDQAAAIVNQFYKPSAFTGIPANAVLVPMPSTSGHNILPALLAQRIAEQQGATVAVGRIGVPTARIEAKRKNTFWAKMEDPVNYLPGDSLNLLHRATGPIYLVEDVHNTGESWLAMRSLLNQHGISVAGLATLTATDLRVTSPRDIERLSEKVAESTQTPLEEVSAILYELFNGSYKQFFNKAEHIVSGEASQARRLLDFARLRSKAGKTQSADVRRTAETVPGQGNQNSVANEQPSLFSPDRLNDSTIQGYFDLPDVAVPIAKRAAAKKSIRAAGAVRGDDYSVSDSAGSVRQRQRIEEQRERAQRDWRGLIGKNVEALKETFRTKNRFSTLLHDFVTHDLPRFDIRGAIIKGPEDFAAFNLAVRTPYFESLKIAILDSASQVVHSQIVHVGSLNEAMADPKSIARVIAAAREQNPKAKLAGWMVAHNHPSGDPSPSDADQRMTRRFASLAEVVGLPLLDHVVTNGERYFSFAESGLLGSQQIDASIDQRSGRPSKPKLPVKPTPDGPGYGRMSDWEAVAAGSASLPKINNSAAAVPYFLALKTADPDHHHVLYLDTRLALRGVERFPLTLTTEQLFLNIMNGCSREGALAFSLGLPADFNVVNEVGSKPAPSDDQRRLIRRLKDKTSVVGLQFVDAMTVSNAGFFSFQEYGLMEEGAKYGDPADISATSTATVDTAAHEAATSPKNALAEPTQAQKEGDQVLSARPMRAPQSDFVKSVKAKTVAGRTVGTSNATAQKGRTGEGTDPEHNVNLDRLRKTNPEAYRKNALLLTRYPLVGREQRRLADKMKESDSPLIKIKSKLAAAREELKAVKNDIAKAIAKLDGVQANKIKAGTVQSFIENNPSKKLPASALKLERAIAELSLRETYAANVQKLKIAELLDSKKILTLADAEDIYESYIKAVESNLTTLIDLFPEKLRDIATLWYDGANIIAQQFAERYSASLEQASAVLAVFSPQKDWFMNVSLAERMMNIWKYQQDFAWTPEMTKQFIRRSGEPQIKQVKGPDGTKIDEIDEDGNFVYEKGAIPVEQEDGSIVWKNWDNEKAAANMAEAKLVLVELEGKTLRQLNNDPELQARFIRMFSEVYHDIRYQKVTPDGHFVGNMTNDKGAEMKIAWGGYNTIEKAISIMAKSGQVKGRIITDEHEVISAALGDQHKVRSFYNNIVDPLNESGHVTMDTHAVAALLWQALSGASIEVSQNFGSAGVQNDGAAGIKGMYAANAEAYRRAAIALGLLPREVQSITWEAVRLLFPASWKSQKANVDAVRAVWDDYLNHAITIQQARERVFELATTSDEHPQGRQLGRAIKDGSGVGDPSWSTEMGNGPSDSEDLQGADDPRRLSSGGRSVSGPGRNAGKPGRGDRGRGTAAVVRSTAKAVGPALGARAMRARTAMDAEYLAAVESGDMTKAQAMVDEAARDAGYEIKAWHGSPDARFLKTDPVFRQKFRKINVQWFAKDRRVAVTYADDRRAFDYQNAEPATVQVFLRLKNPLTMDAQGQHWRDAQRRGKTSDVIEEAQAKGHDGVIITNVQDDYQSGGNRKTTPTTTYSTFTAEQIKSADPVTRDDQGKVIPLSQRFNTESDSILFSRPMRSAPEMVADSLDAVGNVIAKTGNAMFVTLPVWTASTAANVGSAVVEKTGVQKPLAWLGSNRLDKWVYENWTNKWLWARARTGKDAVKAWLQKPGALNGVGKAVADNALPLWSVPREWLAMMHESQRKAAWGREKAMDLIRALSHSAKVSDLAYPKEFVENLAYRVQMFDAMEGKVPMASLPQPLQELAARLRGMLETTGRELVKQGLMNLDTFEELRDTGWMPRFTEDEAGETAGSWLKAFKLGIKDLKQQRSTAWHIVDTTRKEPDGQYVTVNRTEGAKRNRWRFRDQAQRDGFYEDFIRREAVRFLQEGGKDVTNMLSALKIDDKKSIRDEIGRLTRASIDLPAAMTEPMRNITKRAIELQRLRYKKEKPFEPDKLIKDPVYAVARYVMAQTHNAATAELMKETAKVKSWVSEVDTAGMTQIPDNPRFGPLAGKFVRDDIATQVMDVVNVDGAAMKFYDSMLRKWKGGKLVLNPGSHIRDAVGNTAFAYLGGNSLWNPGNWPHYRDAIATLANQARNKTEAVFAPIAPPVPQEGDEPLEPSEEQDRELPGLKLF